MIYLDNAATKAISKVALDAMLPFETEYYGNPSAAYDFAGKGKEVIESTRKIVAKAINVKEKEIYFTSGGTEADNWALKSVAMENIEKGNEIISTKIEHMAVLNSLEFLKKHGFIIRYARLMENGLIDLRDLRRKINNKTILISCMYANNEIGTIEPIEEIGNIARANNILFHTDAVQTVGHIPIDCKKCNINLLSSSCHKFGGPKGVGFLYADENSNIASFIHGGSQESGLRAGTSNVSGIAGMGAALQESLKNMDIWNKKIVSMRNYFINRIMREIPYTRLNGDLYNRLPNNINISFQDVDGIALLEALFSEGICVSGASACKSGEHSVSHVLEAIGVPPECIRGTMRITLSETNTIKELDFVIERIKTAVFSLRKLR